MLGDDDRLDRGGSFEGTAPIVLRGSGVVRDRSRGYPTFLNEGEAEEDDQGPNLLAYLQVVRKHWMVVLAAVIVALGLGVASTLLTQPIYSASVTIQIDKEAAKVVDVQGVEPREISNYEEFFQTQFGLLKSRSLAERTVDRLGLVRDAAFLKKLGIDPAPKEGPAPSEASLRASLIGYLQGNLEVMPVQRSRLVRLTFNSPDPQVSARIANAFAENFISSNLDRRFESSSYARQFLEERIAQVRTKLEESEKALVAYASREEIINLSTGEKTGSEGGGAGSNQSLAATNLNALNGALTGARSERIRAEERWRQAQSNSSAGMPEVLASGAVQGLVSARAKLEGDYQEKLRVYKPDFPEMVQLRARMTELDRQIAGETANVRESLRQQYLVARAQEGAFESQVNRLKSSVLDLRGRTIQYDILQREVDTNRTLYDGLLQRYKEVGVAGGLSNNNISIIDRAQPPGGPSKPQPKRNLMMALIAGLAIGLGLAFLIEFLDESIRSPQDVEQKLGLPLLGTIPKLERGVLPVDALADIRSAFAEAYYSVRTALQFSTEEGVPRSLVVISARPSEGKSTSAMAIAQNMARLGSRVLLIDGDLRNPSLHRLFKIDSTSGLSNYLSGGMTLVELAKQTETSNLFFIPSGPLPPSPAELLAGPRLQDLLNEARSLYDIVVIDGPPVMGLADAPLIASKVAGTILVVEAGGTRRNLVRAAIRRLGMGDARLLGVLLTKFDARKSSYGYGYGYGYGYDYDYGARPALKNGS